MKVLLGVVIFCLAFSGCLGAAGDEFCYETGYLSPSGRLWTLGALAYPASGNYQLNLCGASVTSCPNSSVVCQSTGTPYSLGSRSTYSILETSTDLNLLISVSLGDFCTADTKRQAILSLVCGGSSTTFTVNTVTPDSCNYRVEMSVPLSLCGTITPTMVPPPSFCSPNGYVTPSGRTWTLENFSPDHVQDGYDWSLDLCGSEVSDCASGTVLCQDAGNDHYALGQRRTWNVLDYLGNDTTLVVSFSGGDNCGGEGDREVIFYFTCTDDLSGVNFLVSEVGTCNYVTYVNVPTARCQPGETTPIPLPQFCQNGGFYQNNLRWDLRQLDANFPNGTFNYVMNPCGNTITACGANTVLCQETGGTTGVSFGLRSTFSIDIFPEQDNTLHVSYGLGDFCPESNADRQVQIYYHCTTAPSVFFNISQPSTCEYVVDVGIPAYMCVNIGPTSTPPIPPAPWCQFDGFVSPTSRKWTLSNFDPSIQTNEYDYRINLCGTVSTNCDNSVVLCQQDSNDDNAGMSLGIRDTYNVQEQLSNDTTLVVGYFLGENCGADDRKAYIYFHCTNDPAFISISETSTCVYRMDVNVPLQLCVPVSVSPVPPAPWCTPYGYFSQTNRLWQLQTYAPSIADSTYNFKMDLCGGAATVCGSSSVLCQEDSSTAGWSIGARNTWNLDEDASFDTTLVVHYSLGDWCGDEAGARQAMIYFHCMDFDLFLVNEASTCNYVINVNVPTAYCYTATPTPSPKRLPFCTSRGYTDAFSTQWSLTNFAPNTATNGYYYNMNLCGSSATACGADSILCQQTSATAGWSLGSRAAGVIDTVMSQNNELAVFYQMGDNCGGTRYRDTLVVFRCTGDDVPSFNIIEINICEYYVSVNVPSAMCGIPVPTLPPVPAAPFCAGGYLSATDRFWQLHEFNPNDASGQYNFVMNLCGHQNTACPPGSVLCQMDSDATGYSLGSRWTYNIRPVSDDDTLSVAYSFGDDCGGFPRSVIMNFHCVDFVPSGANAMNVSEITTCSYVVDVAVPNQYCESGGHLPAAPWCDVYGYYSPTGRVWNLQNILPAEEQVGYWPYWLDVCGQVDTSCPEGVVLCQSGFGEWYGLRDSWDIETTLSDDDTLVVTYSLGDYCGVVGTDRLARIYFHCTDEPTDLVFQEPQTCQYRVDVNVPTSMCQFLGPTTPPPPPAPYCINGGYISPTSRAWNLEHYTPGGVHDNYLFVFDACGNEYSNCPSDSALCQMQDESTGYSVATRSTYQFFTNTSNDLTLTLFYYGESCGGLGPRQTIVTLHCTDTLIFVVNETTTCSYHVDINVPTSLCTPVGPTAPPLPDPPYCESSGYLSPTNRLWNLGSLTMAYPEGIFFYELDLCGHAETYCGDDAVLCQAEGRDYIYSLGSRHFWNIMEERSTDLDLAVGYSLGDSLGCQYGRTVELHFHCTEGEFFDVTEMQQCQYRADIVVPTRLCQTIYPTPSPPPVPEAPFCGNGYFSSYNKLWQLSTLNPTDSDSGYAYTLDLCGTASHSCVSGSVLCQSGNNLALRSTYEIMESQSTENTLVVNYYLGDWCNPINGRRTVTVYFQCTDALIPFAAEEPSTCFYTANVTVPTALCRSVSPTVPPEPEAPYCSGGYRSPTGRLWNLAGFTPNGAEDGYAYVLNTCGTTPTRCSSDTVLCQFANINAFWSLGRRNTWSILPTSDDDDLVVSYGIGDWCGGSFGNRRVVITYHCADSGYSFDVTEIDICDYVIQITVPTSRCQPGTPPPPPVHFCTEDGYVSPTGRLWHLSALDPNHAVSNFNYAMNLCGNSPTSCGDSAVCQSVSDQEYYSLGNRTALTVLPISDDLTLRLRYTGGTSAFCPEARQVYINLHCANAAQYDFFNVTESATCVYEIDASVPPSMCTIVGPPIPPADYCTDYGYLSPTNRLWQLSTYTSSYPAPEYNYMLDLCGAQDTVCYQGSAVCQEVSDTVGFNLGLRSTWTVLPTSTDDTLIVSFSLGDNFFCNNGTERQAVVSLHCTDSASPVYMLMNETAQCLYYFDANVPTRLCGPGRPTRPPTIQAPFCTGGYLSPTYREWDLSAFDFRVAENSNVYMDLCGTWNYGCPAGSVMCEQYDGVVSYSLGQRTSWNILPSNDTTLSVSYTMGDYCGAVQASRQLIVNMHCTTSNTPGFSWNENPTCTYIVDLFVPASMCVAAAPTLAPIPNPAFCDPLYGYYSPTGRLWRLSQFQSNDVDDDYNYILNLCGNRRTPCPSDTLVCQQWSDTYGIPLASRSTWQISETESTDTTIVMNYGSGEACGDQGARQLKLYLNCKDSPAGAHEHMDITEPSTCRYNASVNVPTAFCQLSNPSIPPPPPPTYCETSGYYSSTGRLWKFKGFNPNWQVGQYDYQLDLCGNDPTLCDPISILCQEVGEEMAYSLGSRWAYQITDIDDVTLQVSYAEGDDIYCSTSRRSTVRFHCTSAVPGFIVNETSQCNYLADVNVPSIYCPRAAPTQGPSITPTPSPVTPSPLPQAPFCKPEGYLSTSNVVWNLTDYNPDPVALGTSFFVFDVCGGHQQTICADDTVLCDERTQSLGYTVAKRSSFQIIASDAVTLKVQYTLGDYCDLINASRTALVTFLCTDDKKGFNVTEVTTCSYSTIAYVPTALCKTSLPPAVKSDSSSLSNGAIAGIAVAVVGVAGAGAAVAGVKAYKMRQGRNFRPQVD